LVCLCTVIGCAVWPEMRCRTLVASGCVAVWQNSTAYPGSQSCAYLRGMCNRVAVWLWLCSCVALVFYPPVFSLCTMLFSLSA
jgi:hypothetical protein